MHYRLVKQTSCIDYYSKRNYPIDATRQNLYPAIEAHIYWVFRSLGNAHTDNNTLIHFERLANLITLLSI
jgi:hypothetical protein